MDPFFVVQSPTKCFTIFHMKRTLLLSFVISLSLSLTGCTKSWNSFNTPEKFLKVAAKNNNNCSIAMNGDYLMQPHKDYNLEIQKALSNVEKFKESSLRSSESERYFSYANMYYNGTIGWAGDLFCVMSVYDDGFIKIDYEYNDKVLKHNYAYFEIGATKAFEINDLVVEKIARENKIKEEDRLQAYKDGSINNFIAAMKEKSSIKTIYYDRNDTDQTMNTYEFYDTGDLLNLIKDVEYVSTSKGYPLEGTVDLIFNVYDENSIKNWTYSLYDTGDYVTIRYNYKNRLGDSGTATLNYEIDATKGKAILAKALELAK